MSRKWCWALFINLIISDLSYLPLRNERQFEISKYKSLTSAKVQNIYYNEIYLNQNPFIEYFSIPLHGIFFLHVSIHQAISIVWIYIDNDTVLFIYLYIYV